MPESISKKRNVDVIIPLITPVYVGYTFEGWALTPDGAAVYHNGDAYSENLSITLYAVWSHAHVYNKQVATSPYFCSPANCIDKALYYKSCVCGESSEGKTDEKFEYGSLGNHTWDTLPSAQFTMNKLFYLDQNNDGAMTEADPYLETNAIGDILEAWNSAAYGGDKPEDLGDLGDISPCIYCGGHKIKSAKIYSVNRTTCTRCHISNSGYVFVWDCYDCSNKNTQQYRLYHPVHDFGAWTVISPANCMTTGQEKRVCLFEGCDAFETQVIPLGFHKPGASVTRSANKICPICNDTISGTYKHYTCSVCAKEYDDTVTWDTHFCKPGGGGGGSGEGDTYCPNSGCHAKLEWREGYHYLGDDWPSAPKHADNYYCPSCKEYVVWGKIVRNCVEVGISWGTFGGIALGDTPCPKCDSVGTLHGVRYRCMWCNEDMGGEAQCKDNNCLTTFKFNKYESF